MFSTTIADGCISLHTASNVVRFSFIVQDSLSHLDLQVCKSSNRPDYFLSFCNNCKSRPTTDFVNTEEKCQKFFAPLRTLLYTLHLDLPTERENCLRTNAHKSSSYSYCHRCCWSPVVSEIKVSYGFYANTLSNFIEDALSVDVPKIGILKWVVKASDREDPILSDLEILTASKFIDCFYPVMTDSALFEDFLKRFDIYEWMGQFENPEILEFLLYHARQLRENFHFEEKLSVDYLSQCILAHAYLNARPILKCISDSVPTYLDYDEYLSDIQEERPDLTQEVINKAAESKTHDRICRMAQIIWIFLDIQSPDLPSGIHEDASEALRLVWSSIPDPCITYAELGDVFEAGFSEEELKNVFDFYVRAIEESHEHLEPRSLQHLCRIFLRRSFQKKNLWIPDAISLMGLPKSLMSFLNLEKKVSNIANGI